MVKLLMLSMLFFNVNVYASGYAQLKNISLNMRNVSAMELFAEIRNQTGYSFVFNTVHANNLGHLNVSVKNKPLNEVLDSLLADSKFEYRVDNNIIVITSRSQTQQTNQEKVLSGVVLDSHQKPILGASVVVLGTNIGTSTDEQGRFVLKSASLPAKSKLQITFIGMKPIEMEYVLGKNLNIVMHEAVESFSEVVVTGYQTLSRERATGSFEVLGEDELSSSLTPDLLTRLTGKIAGLQITQKGMTIRGKGSILSNTEPLVVVDGFPIEGGMSSVNPDDVHSVTVLKDAAAASIWGTRAANGVIVITTKRGKQGKKAVLDVSYYLTIKNKTDLGEMHYLNAEQSVDHWLELIKTGNSDVDDVSWFHGALNKVEEAYYTTRMRLGEETNYDMIVADPAFQKTMAELKRAKFRDQFRDNLMRNQIMNRMNISLSGGGEKSDYYLSGVYNTSSDEMIGNSNNDVVVNFRHNYQLSPRIKLSTAVNTMYDNRKQNGVSISDYGSEAAFHNLIDEKGNRIQYYMIDPLEGKRLEELGYLPYTTNMIDNMEQNDVKEQSFSARLQAALGYKIIDGLNIETRFQYERGLSKRENIQRVSHPETRRMINAFTLVKDDGGLNLQFPLGSIYDVNNTNFEAWTWRNQLDFNKSWQNDKHALTALLGHEVRMYRSQGNSTTQYGFDEVSLSYIPVNEDLLRRGEYNGWVGFVPYTFSPFNNYSDSDNRDISMYLNGAYTFNDRYTASISGRVDQSNIFGNDSKYRYNIIWSSGLSWNITKERFAQTDWLNHLVLRVTCGLGGNVNKKFYPVLMGEKLLDHWTGATYLGLTNPANKNLKWETTKTLNFGLDFSVLNDRIAGSIDLYRKKGSDLLGRKSLDPTNGWAAATMNFASVMNKGVELSLDVKPVVTRDFVWNVGVNISYNNNKVIDVEDAGISVSDYLQEEPTGAIKGKPLSRLYAYKYAGVDTNGEPLLWKEGAKVSWREYTANTTDLSYVGMSVAPWYGGINTSLTYKNLTLSTMAQYEFGHKFKMPVSDPMTNNGVYTNVADRWRKPGDEKNTIVPRLSDDWNTGYNMIRYYRSADAHIRNAANLTINEVTLSYQLPETILRSVFSNVNVSFQVRNPYQWNANKENVKPQSVFADGWGSSDFMSTEPCSFIFGIKATF